MVYFPLVTLAGFVHKSIDGFGSGVKKGHQAVCLGGLVGFREGHSVVGVFAQTNRLALNGLKLWSPVARVSSRVLNCTSPGRREKLFCLPYFGNRLCVILESARIYPLGSVCAACTNIFMT